MSVRSEYVTLRGGPWDGRREGVIEGVNSLNFSPPVIPQINQVIAPVDQNPIPRLSYRRCPAEPHFFDYEETP